MLRPIFHLAAYSMRKTGNPSHLANGGFQAGLGSGVLKWGIAFDLVVKSPAITRRYGTDSIPGLGIEAKAFTTMGIFPGQRQHQKNFK